MTLEIGSVVEGVVTGIAPYGAFVRLPKGNTGLIHISEVADAYVKDVRQFLNEKDKITVKVLGVNNKGKYDLSLKQVEGNKQPEPEVVEEQAPIQPEKPEVIVKARTSNNYSNYKKPPPREKKNVSFEDKLSRFLKESEERILDLKRNTEAKRGKGRGR